MANDITQRYLLLIKTLIENKEVSSGKEFAQRIGVSPSSLTEINNGRMNVGLAALQKSVRAFPSINLDWLMCGVGEIFKTKTPKNVVNQKDDIYDDNFDDKRKLQKTSSNDEGNFKTKTPKNVTLENSNIKGNKKGNIPKLQKTLPLNEDNSPTETDSDSEVIRGQENVFTGMTDKEVLDIIEEGFEAHLMEMYEAGRAVPAVTVQQYKEDIKELTTQVARLEYENKELRLKLDAVTGRPRGKKATETGNVDTGKGTQKKSL